MKKILFSLIPSLWIASIILHIMWASGKHHISGWWSFSTLMVAIFLSEYEARN
jgi:hypothetical protein